TFKAAVNGSPSNMEYWKTSALNLTTSAQTFGPFQYTCNNANASNETLFVFTYYLAYGATSDVWIDKVTLIDITQAGPVTDVAVSPAALRLAAGQTRQLAAAVSPVNASNQSLSWSSDNESVATVSSTGEVTAISAGTATVTATTADGGYTASSIVTVKPVGTNLVRNNEFDDGLSDWTFRDWTSGGGNTASVTENGELSGGKALYVDIVNDDNSEWTINANQDLDGMIEVGKTYEISFMARAESTRDVKMAISGVPSNGAYWQKTVTVTTTPQTFGPFVWNCTNVGSSTSFYTSFMFAKGVISDVWIDKVIINDISEGAGVVSGITITPELTLTNGQSTQLIKTIMPSNAANQEVNWISSNTAVATVDEDGVVSAESPGAATITATTEDGAYQATSIITVLPAGTSTNQNGEFDEGLS